MSERVMMRVFGDAAGAMLLFAVFADLAQTSWFTYTMGGIGFFCGAALGIYGSMRDGWLDGKDSNANS